MPAIPFELPSFATLNEPLLEAGFGSIFIGRVPGVDVFVDREEALHRLSASRRTVMRAAGIAEHRFCFANQVHGRDVEIVTLQVPVTMPIPAADGLVTSDPGCVLAIYVADCCAVSVVDPVRKIAALTHSGRKGSELDVTGNAIDLLGERFGSLPSDLIVHLSPCIRPPHYEVDFAAYIKDSASRRGVRTIIDDGICTGANVDRYYSYRLEKGKTGRMVSLLWIR